MQLIWVFLMIIFIITNAYCEKYIVFVLKLHYHMIGIKNIIPLWNHSYCSKVVEETAIEI